MKINFKKTIPFLLSTGFIFIFLNGAGATVVSPDAIAFRAIPNPEHSSPLRWYKENVITPGNPQSLLVDGYEAVRDGRTVYVDAANITDSKLYTNIYMISYNQSSEESTVDIFGKILSRWQFNANLTATGLCYTATDSCSLDIDCPKNFSCGSSKKCEMKCLTDDECLTGSYCDSPKAAVVRDTRRLSDLKEIKISIEEYKASNGKYPTLSAGTYLPNRTVSVWPSWKENLSEVLKQDLPVDPINKLGDCGFNRYDTITCWDEINKEFADPDVSNKLFEMPAKSHVYLYTALNDGTGYDVCAMMDSGYISITSQGACLSSD